MPRLTLYSYTSLLVIGAVLSSMYGEVYRYEFMGFWLVVLASVFVFFNVEIKEAFEWVIPKIKRITKSHA